MKKLIALLCTVCMIATMVPFTAFAEGESYSIWNSWDGSADITVANCGFQTSNATVTERTIINDAVLGGNSGPYMQFKTSITDTNEPLVFCTSVPMTKQYVALSINVYGKGLQDAYARLSGNVKPVAIGNITGILKDAVWNNVFVIYNNVAKTTDVYVNGEFVSTQNFYDYIESLNNESAGITATVDRETGKWTYVTAKANETGNVTMADFRFRFVRDTKNVYTWTLDDLYVLTSDTAIEPTDYATLTGDSNTVIEGNLINIDTPTATLAAEGAKIMVNGAEGNVVKGGDKVVVVTPTTYGNLYSAPYTVKSNVSIHLYDGSSMKKGYYTDANGAGMADVDDRWRLANINDGVTANVTTAIGGKINDGYIKFSGKGEHNMYNTTNSYSTRYFALSINVYGQNLRDIWSRLNSGSNKITHVAEGNKYGGHITSALTADVWNNVFFVFDSQTKTSKTYLNGKLFRTANLYNTVEKALSGTVDREAGTATANKAEISADFMNLKKDIRFLFQAEGRDVYVDDIATINADYELTPAALAEVTVEGAKVSDKFIYMNEGVETATIAAEGATVLVDSGEGYAEAAEIKSGDKVVVVNKTAYGTIYDNYTVFTPVYGSYEAAGKPNAKWSYAHGVLTIYGSGDLPAYSDDTKDSRPWIAHIKDITKVVIEEGITLIGTKSFMVMDNLKEVVIPDTVLGIGGYAFQNTKLVDVVLPEGVTTYNDFAFYNVTTLKTITLPSTLNIPVGAKLNGRQNAENVTTINVPWYATKALAWAEDYKAKKMPDAVINISNDGKNGYLKDTKGVANAFYWEIDPATGELTIEKTDVESNGQIQTFTGHMPGKAVELIAPWYYQAGAGAVKSVVIAEGITHIPSQILRSNGAYTKVTLPSTLRSSSTYAFNAAKVTELYIAEGANFAGAQMINDNSDIEKLILPSTMTPAKDFIRDFTFGIRGNMNSKDIVIVAPFGSPAYAWAQARYAEAVAQMPETKKVKDQDVTQYWGMPAGNMTIKASYEITGNADGVVTVANNTGHAVASAYVIVAYYDNGNLDSLATVKISGAQTLADAVNQINVGAYDAAEGKTVRVYLWNNLTELKPMAGIYAE